MPVSASVAKIRQRRCELAAFRRDLPRANPMVWSDAARSTGSARRGTGSPNWIEMLPQELMAWCERNGARFLLGLAQVKLPPGRSPAHAA
jgi:hypothetical protein